MSDLLNNIRAQAEAEGDTETLEALSLMSDLQTSLLLGVVESIGSGLAPLLAPLAEQGLVAVPEVSEAIAQAAQNVVQTLYALGAQLPGAE